MSSDPNALVSGQNLGTWALARSISNVEYHSLLKHTLLLVNWTYLGSLGLSTLPFSESYWLYHNLTSISSLYNGVHLLSNTSKVAARSHVLAYF